MYEYLAKRPVPEKKDPRPSSRARYLNAADKSGENKFSPGNVGIQYDPQKTAQLKAHAFTKSPAALKKSTPRGVIQRVIWMYDESDHQWHKKSKMDEKGDKPFPANPVDGMYFDDVTGDQCSPGEPMYLQEFQSFMQRRNQRSEERLYDDFNRLSAFAQTPRTGRIETPFDAEGIGSRVNRLGRRNYVAVTRGAGRAALSYSDISRAQIPSEAFTAAADYMSAPPDAPVVPYSGTLSDRQRAVMSGFVTIQHIEDHRAPSGGTFPIAAARAAADKGFSAVRSMYPFAPRGGAQATRDLLSGTTEFDQRQADMFFPYVPSSPEQQDEDQDPGGRE